MPPSEGQRVWTVSALTTAVKLRLEEHFPMTWVAGEVSNFVRATSGHLYFTLKDDKSALRCCLWRAFALRLKFEPKNGMQVLVRGGLTVFPPRGEYQLIVEELQPKGIGSAELALRQLREKLLKRGYFDPNRKKALPRYPQRIALVASPTGAAIRDMLELLTHRWPIAEVVVRPSRVQGDGAAEDVALALRQLNQLHTTGALRLDAIVVGRGGGSSEDLAAFNEEIVADAIFQSAVPVVSAVGHEIDVSIADLVADYRALTPSEGITALCPDHRELMDDLKALSDQLHDAMRHQIILAKQQLNKLADRPALRKPLDRIRDLEQRLDDAGTRLGRAARLSLARYQDQVSALADHLESLNPLNVLKRGYSLTRIQSSESLLRDAAQTRPGDRLVTRLAHGEIVSRVEAVHDPLASQPQVVT